MGYLSLENLLRPTTSPAQANFLNNFYVKFDSDIGLHKKILNVEPLFYQGPMAGTEFLVYSINRLYLSLNSVISGQTYVVYIGGGEIELMDENNVTSFRLNNYLFQYVSAVLELVTYNNYSIDNFYFSRIVPGVIATYIKFDGYRITLN
jgi:hypothetical protein